MAAIIAPCINDGAYITAAAAQGIAIVAEATVQSLVQKAILEWRRNTESMIADMRTELADRRMAMAEAIIGHAQAGWTQERALVNATMGEAAPGLDYSGMAAADAHVERAWAEADYLYDRNMFKFGIVPALCDDHRMSRAISLGKTDILAHQMRVAEGRQIALSDRRFDRQNTVLAMGRGILAEAASMGQLAGGRDIVRQSILGTINSAVSMFGYATTALRTGSGGAGSRGWNTSGSIPPTLARTFERAGYRAEDATMSTGTTVNVSTQSFNPYSLSSGDVNANGDNN